MLQIKTIKESPEWVIERLAVKRFDAKEIVGQLQAIDQERRKTKAELDNVLAQSNQIAKTIGQMFKSGQAEQATQAKEQAAQLKELSAQLDAQLAELEAQQHKLLVQLPNLPHASVPQGRSAQDNEVVRAGGPEAKPMPEALPHWDLASRLDIIDFELGVKLTGAGFPVYKGKGARLQRALISFFLDRAEAAGFREVIPPLMVNEDSGFGTGQLPDKEGQMYHVGIDNLYLIPTAEVPITNIYRDTILKASELPVKNAGYTPCFRREAGSYGKDVRGLNRLHQFDKVEVVVVAHPEQSYAILEQMVEHVESLVRDLGLPYRILRLCGGDMGFTSALTYDFEVFSAAQDRWLEVSSVSNFEEFQSNRLKLRFKDEGDKKTTLAHTLNGSALALPRIVAALLENFQTPEGRVRVPQVLVPYTGFELL